ncbi:PREDICTED: putative disease resistance protein At4g11170 [Camelina sativa]|uniref:Disease resistance protein At4g11170 n=1 Tax=Camelina sativa TaxID=90675 RepID=A0ABM1Q7C6_CAMSA|nr:PREDICTED: putative disease resistance protein At4g11170 [Camelina sativa]
MDHVKFSCLSFAGFPCMVEVKLINLNIEDIPDDICQLELLETLDLSGNDFVYLPTSMRQLAMLEYLSLSNCRKLKALPQLPQVGRLVLSGCVKLGSLMGILGAGRNNLLEFCLEKCKSIGSLMGILNVEKAAPGRKQLVELCLENCKSLGSLSEELSHFTKLTYLDLSSLNFRKIPTSIRELSVLRTLCLNNCKKIYSLKDLPGSVKYLYAHGCESLDLVYFSSNHSFNHLDFSHCLVLHCISDLVLKFMNEEYSQEAPFRLFCTRIFSSPSTFDIQTSLREPAGSNYLRLKLTPSLWDSVSKSRLFAKIPSISSIQRFLTVGTVKLAGYIGLTSNQISINHQR